MPLHLFILLIFLLNFIILLLIKPIGNNFVKSETDQSNIPQLLFKDFKLFDIGANSIVETTLSGKQGEGFRDGSYRIRDVKISYQNSKHIENIKSRYAYYSNNVIDAMGGVLYTRSDNSSIQTEKLSYDIENQYFYIPNRFVFERGGMITKGETLIIHRKLGKIKAFNIDTTLNR